MTREEQLAVCNAFVLGEPLACAPLGGTRNGNFLLKTPRGNFVARDRYIGYRDPPRITFDHAVLQFLFDRQVAVAIPMRTPTFESVLRQRDHLWEVFRAAPGKHFRDGDKDDLHALAEALAEFHRRGREFPISPQPFKLGPRGETDPKELLQLLSDLRMLAPREVKPYNDWLRAATNDLPDYAFNTLPHTLIHGDIQPANILINEGRVSALIDLDWCAWRPRIYDLAFAILLCCTTHETPINGSDIWSLSQSPHVDVELVRLFLKTYERQGWPLSIEERTALRAQVMLSWCHVRLAGAMKVEPARRAEFLARPPHDLASLFPDGIT